MPQPPINPINTFMPSVRLVLLRAPADISNRVTLAFEKLTPLQCCARFSRGVGRPVRYVRGPIEIAVSIPSGYREELEILQETLGEKRAPYFGPELEYPREARRIWEGYRGIEEYAREIFPLEEHANGLRWMDEPGGPLVEETDLDVDEDDDASPGSKAVPSATLTPSGSHHRMSVLISGKFTPRSHPESGGDHFFVGSV